MTEQGTVVKEDGKYAVVRLDRKDECSKCGMCLFPKGANFIDVRAENGANAKVNDQVIIESKEDGKLLGIFLVFLVPLLLIGVSAVVSFLIVKSELCMLIMSIALVVLWFFVLSFIDKKIRKSNKLVSVITKIIK